MGKAVATVQKQLALTCRNFILFYYYYYYYYYACLGFNMYLSTILVWLALHSFYIIIIIIITAYILTANKP
jgi:hypothetical protein